MMYLDDFKPGERAVFGSHTFTAQEIIAFAKAYDPQPFHVDEAAGKASHFGALVASGWHTASMWMRLNVAHFEGERRRHAAAGQALGEIGPSPGFKDLAWKRPVKAGDTITFGAEVVDTRPTASRPGWGLLTRRAFGINQDGEEVLSFTASNFMERRPKA